MKIIGLIGGMSWESSKHYYQLLNELVKEKLGGLHSAECLMYSVDFELYEKLQQQGEWDEAGERLGQIAKRLESAGADMILLCTNTMHKVADKIEEAIQIPFVHIGDATAEAIVEAGISKVVLLGTRYTMEQDFYQEKLKNQGIQVMIPNQQDRTFINKVIFEELCLGSFKHSSKEAIIKIINNFKKEGAEGVILGCTELPLLINQKDSPLPLLNTMDIHVKKGVELALKVE